MASRAVRLPLAAGAHSRRLVFGAVLLLVLQWSSLVLAATSSSPKSLPYIPTTILINDPARNANAGAGTAAAAYIFAPKDDSVDVLMLNFSTTIRSSSLNPQTLTSKAPFLSTSGNATAFTPTLLADGTLAVYAGDCLSSTGPSIWTYSPSSPKWTQHTAQLQGSSGRWWNMGPSFLGGAVAYSSQLSPSISPGTIYSYGGMCPPGNQTTSTWQVSASYSNQIVKLTTSPGSAQDGSYAVTPVASKGPPLAGAGFTFTALSPSTTNRSGVVTQQVNHLLLGGHTGTAFMNMSMAAVWSLPEEAWSFVSIKAEVKATTELAIKDRKADAGVNEKRAMPVNVGSRSGHTAVLNADGTAVIVFGGWVGDVSQAAEPQLAVLEMGSDYGQWQWSVPETQPSGGIYGHGAALLPGNVMMVYGGYSNSFVKVKARQASGTPMFLNLTSFSWSDSYTNPASGLTPETSTSTLTPDNTSRNLGLGLGLGLGVPGLALLFLLLIYLCRRRRRSSHSRDAAVRALAQDHSQFLHNADTDIDDMTEAPHTSNSAPSFFPWTGASARDWYTGGHDPYAATSSRSLGYESLRGARSQGTFYNTNPPQTLFSPSHSPERAPPRNAARGLYQPTTLADYESRATQRGTGGIHPIHEEDEDDSAVARGPLSPDKDETDPFATPTSAVAPPYAFPAAPEATHRPAQDKEVQDWVSDVDAADVLIAARAIGRRSSPIRRSASARTAGGLGSPSPMGSSLGADGDEARTVSNLSERSAAFSFVGSMRNVVAAVGGKDKDHPPGSSSSTSNKSEGGASFNTARSSFPALQAEGPALLHRGNTSPLHNEGAAGEGEDDAMMPTAPGSPSKNKPRRSKGWLGSFRRVFSNSGASSPDSSLARDESPSRRSLDANGRSVDWEPRLFGLKDMPNATLLRRKQGREGWEEALRRSGSGGRTSGDWDVERAGEGRNVQVMFTVPKGKLRVVNAVVEDDGEERGEIVDPEKELLVDEAVEEELLEMETEEDRSAYLHKHKDVFADWMGSTREERKKDLGTELLFDSSIEKRAAAHPEYNPPKEDDPFWSPVDQSALTQQTTPPPIRQSNESPSPTPPPQQAPLTDHTSPPIRPSIESPSFDEKAPIVEDDSSWAKGLRKDLDRALATPSPSRTHDDDDEMHEVHSPIMTAEAVRLKRPSTRVLAMVEQYETKSRESSPSHSPCR